MYHVAHSSIPSNHLTGKVSTEYSVLVYSLLTTDDRRVVALLQEAGYRSYFLRAASV